jgi:serine/threonine protein kinase
MPRYHLKALIGAGTFAEVWHADRLDDHGKCCAPDVALKIGWFHRDDERTKQELAILYQIAPLQLEGTTRILDIAWLDGKLVVAMELADNTLLGIVRQGISAAEVLRLIGEVANTLDDMRGRRLVHGGINPTDILIHAGRAKIADFGPLPRAGDKSRIPFYKAVCMAPELKEGVAAPESDQYALAATYAWLRLARRAFSISRRGELPGDIDVGLLPEPEKEVLLTALNREPKQRFASCYAFVEALRKTL